MGVAVAVRAEIDVRDVERPEVGVRAIHLNGKTSVETGGARVGEPDYRQLAAVNRGRGRQGAASQALRPRIEPSHPADRLPDRIHHSAVRAAQPKDDVRGLIVGGVEPTSILVGDGPQALGGARHGMRVRRAVENVVVQRLEPGQLELLVAQVARDAGVGLAGDSLNLIGCEKGAREHRSQHAIQIFRQQLPRHGHGERRDLFFDKHAGLRARSPRLGNQRQLLLGSRVPRVAEARFENSLGRDAREPFLAHGIVRRSGPHHHPHLHEWRGRIQRDHLRSLRRPAGRHRDQRNDQPHRYSQHGIPFHDVSSPMARERRLESW